MTLSIDTVVCRCLRQLETVGEVPWRHTLEAAVDKHSELVVNPLLHLQPVQLLGKKRHVLVFQQREQQ